MGDRVDFDEPLEPVRHRIYRYEGIRQESEREQYDHGYPLYTGSRTRNNTEECKDPADRPGASDHEQRGNCDITKAAFRPVAHQISHAEGQHRGNGVTDRIGEQSSGQRGNPRDRQ
ncbi:hypothetical protein D3C73_1285730 [compost metagenome]